MKTDSIKIQNLFILPRRHIVPLFQRPYVWTREEQWEPLWEDITSVAERVLAGRNGRPHFLGAVVLDQLRTPSKEIEARLVIDGQQRLTTLQLLLAAFRDVCAQVGDSTSRRKLLRVTENEDADREDHEQRCKVWPTNVDRGQFAAVMRFDESLLPEHKLRQAEAAAPGSPRIAEAYGYFLDKVREWVGESGEEERAQRIEALVETLLAHLYLVAIDLGEEDDAQVIFETLNARGTPLLPIDLVKNHLFHEAASSKLDVERLYATYWKGFDEESGFWRKKVGRGHAQRPRVDLYLQHYLTMMTKDEVSVAHIFTVFKEFSNSRRGDTGPGEHMELLSGHADIFRAFEEEPHTTAKGRFLYRLRSMDVTTAYPLLLQICSRSDLAEASLEQIFADLESLLVRRLVCRLSTRGYNRLFLELLGISRQSSDPAASVRGWLLDQTAEANRWPTDEEFQRGWSSLRPFQELFRARLRMILEAIEAQLRSDKSEDIELRSTLQVEHLMPQAWEEHWPLPEGMPPVEAKIRRNENIHRFGNLTLLTKKLNPAVSNSGWERKRQGILEHSALALNRRFQEVPTWDEERIDQRTAEMFEVAARIWRRPEVGHREESSKP